MTAAQTPSCVPFDHDWRVDPFIILTSYPPSERHVCAACGASRTQAVQRPKATPADVRTWPKVERGFDR